MNVLLASILIGLAIAVVVYLFAVQYKQKEAKKMTEKEKEMKERFEQVQDSGVPITIYYFYKPTCPSCKAFEEPEDGQSVGTIDALEEWLETINIDFVRVNRDNKDELVELPEHIKEYIKPENGNVPSVPWLFADIDGSFVVYEPTRARTLEDLQRWVTE